MRQILALSVAERKGMLEAIIDKESWMARQVAVPKKAVVANKKAKQ